MDDDLGLLLRERWWRVLWSEGVLLVGVLVAVIGEGLRGQWPCGMRRQLSDQQLSWLTDSITNHLDQSNNIEAEKHYDYCVYVNVEIAKCDVCFVRCDKHIKNDWTSARTPGEIEGVFWRDCESWENEFEAEDEDTVDSVPEPPFDNMVKSIRFWNIS